MGNKKKYDYDKNGRFVLGKKWQPVRQDITFRRFAFNVALKLTQQNRDGFLLDDFRDALIKEQKRTGAPQPTGGWEKHNMPTWAAGQGWIVPVGHSSAAKV